MANCIVITASSNPTTISTTTITNNQTEPRINNNTSSSLSSLYNTTNCLNTITSVQNFQTTSEKLNNLNPISSNILDKNYSNHSILNHQLNTTNLSENLLSQSVFRNKNNFNNLSDNIDNTKNLQFCCCAVDKIKIRKDLQKWSKNILLFAGLERVAIELIGVKLWHKVFSSFYCLQTNEPCDWIPEEICFFCNKKIPQTEFNSTTNYLNGQTNNNKLVSNNLFCSKNDSNQLNSSMISNNMAGKKSNNLSEEINLNNEPFQHLGDCHLKNFSSLLESKVLPCSCSLPDDTTADLDCSSTKSENPSLRSNTYSSPTKMIIAESQFTSLASLLTYKPNKTLPNENLSSNSFLDQPLDLSTHTRNKIDNALNMDYSIVTNNKNSINVKPKKSRSEGTWKRTYTEEELEKALDDIQSGKLGTRRAAALYRIPRSTLRNKVYKLTQEKNGTDKNIKNSSTASNISPVKKLIDLKATNLLVNNDNNLTDLVNQSQKIENIKFGNEPFQINNSIKELLIHQKNNKSLNNQNNTNNSTTESVSELINTSNLHQNFQQAWQQIQQQQVFNNLALQTGSNNQLNNLLSETLIYQILNQQTALDLNSNLLPLLAQFLLNLQINKQEEDSNQQNVSNEEKILNLNQGEDNYLMLNKSLNEKKLIESNLVEENLEGSNHSNLSIVNNSPLALNNVPSSTKLTINENEISNKKDNLFEKKLNSNVLSQSEDSDVDMFAFDDTSNSQQAKNEKDLVQKTINNLSSNLCSSNENVNSNLPQNNPILLNNFANLTTLNNFTNSLKLAPLSLAAGLSNLSNFNSLTNLNTNNTENNLNNKSLKINTNTLNASFNDKLNQFIPINLQNVGISSVNKPNTPNITNESNGVDRKRPKRGRYRNYNRDDLARAVRSVQRGEMSVHRAGTLFGVPHSTLEYKVKERHLLRPKKRIKKQNINSLNNFDTNNLRNVNLDLNLDEQSVKNLNIDNRTNNETIKTDKLKNLLIDEQMFGNYATENKTDRIANLAPLLKNEFFSTIKSNTEETSSIKNNFNASNMIRKIQESVQNSNEDLNQNNCFGNEINNFNINNNVGLISNLIKASLDEHLKNQSNIDCNNNVLENNGENEILNQEFSCNKKNSNKNCDIKQDESMDITTTATNNV